MTAAAVDGLNFLLLSEQRLIIKFDEQVEFLTNEGQKNYQKVTSRENAEKNPLPHWSVGFKE